MLSLHRTRRVFREPQWFHAPWLDKVIDAGLATVSGIFVYSMFGRIISPAEIFAAHLGDSLSGQPKTSLFMCVFLIVTTFVPIYFLLYKIYASSTAKPPPEPPEKYLSVKISEERELVDPVDAGEYLALNADGYSYHNHDAVKEMILVELNKNTQMTLKQIGRDLFKNKHTGALREKLGELVDSGYVDHRIESVPGKSGPKPNIYMITPEGAEEVDRIKARYEDGIQID